MSSYGALCSRRKVCIKNRPWEISRLSIKQYGRAKSHNFSSSNFKFQEAKDLILSHNPAMSSYVTIRRYHNLFSEVTMLLELSFEYLNAGARRPQRLRNYVARFHDFESCSCTRGCFRSAKSWRLRRF